MLAILFSNQRITNHMTSSPKRPWHMFYPLGGFILLCVVWSSYWYFAFTKAREFAESHRQQLLAKGVKLNCGEESWGGFPFRFEFQCKTVALHYTSNGQDLSLQTNAVLVVAQAYNPLHVLVLVDGPSTLRKNNSTLSEMSHNRALISITANLAGAWDISSDMTDVTAQNLFSATSLKLFARQIKDKLDLAATAEKLTLLGPHNATVAIGKAEVVAHTNAAILASPTPLDFAAANGQTFDISTLKLSQNTVELTAQGSMFLQPDHHLAGQLSTQTTDVDGLLSLVSPVFELNQKDRDAMKNLLTLMGNKPDSPTKKAEITARDGKLYWGPFKLADLPPLY